MCYDVLNVTKHVHSVRHPFEVGAARPAPTPDHGGVTDDRENPADVQRRPVSDVAMSLIRTWVPIGVGGIVTWVATRTGTVIDVHTSAAVGGFAAMACASGYYALARVLENAKNPALQAIGKYMLGGVMSKPIYMTQEEYDRLTGGGRHRAAGA